MARRDGRGHHGGSYRRRQHEVNEIIQHAIIFRSVLIDGQDGREEQACSFIVIFFFVSNVEVPE